MKDMEEEKKREELNKIFKQLNEGLKDLPEMIEIQKTIDEKFAKMLEEVNSYLIDKRGDINSEIGRKTIDSLIANNFKQLVEIREREGKKWEEDLNL